MVFVIFFLMSSLVQAEESRVIQVFSHSEKSSLVDFIPSVTKLSGKELVKRRQLTLGDTLQTEAGISSTQYGPNSSRPVIRGLDGARIRVLQNSLGSLDASNQSVDHNIPIDPLLIDQIEVVRGPMSLLYGSSAVGGVVNIVTNRTHAQFVEGLVTEVQAQGETVNNGLSQSARMDYGKNNWMFHLDGSTKNLQDQKIPRYARSKKLRNEDPLASDEEEKDTIENSFSKQNSLGTGITKIFNKGLLGLSFGHLNNEYGSVAEKEVSINMLQNRFELHGEYQFEGFIKKMKLRSTQSDYQHKEIADGLTGTVFGNLGNESRLEFINENDQLKGVMGIHSQVFTFTANGEEAFLPKSKNNMISVFLFQELTKENQAFSFGSRIENSEIKKVSSENFSGSDSLGFTGLNGSLGYRYMLEKDHSLSLNYSYTERAPTFQELLSMGAHVATGTYEIGTTELEKEKAHAVELSWKKESDQTTLGGSLYAQRFDDYIALNPNGTDNDMGTAGDTSDDLPEFEYEQTNAVFYGVDFDAKQRVFENEKGIWNLLGRFDYVRGKDTKSGKNLPRISPARLMAGLEYTHKNWTTDLESQYVFEQTKTAENEDASKRYILTNIGTSYSWILSNSKIDFFLRIRNIFDSEARNHVSTLNNRAPLPGRNFILGGQLIF